MPGVNTSQFNPEGNSNPEKNQGNYENESLINYKFNGQYSDSDMHRFRQIQDLDLKKICFFLITDTKNTSGITYNVFDTAVGKQSADPQHSISRASARFKEFAIFRFWKPGEDMSFPHEITHLVAHRWADPYTWQTDLDTISGKIIKTLEMVSTSFMQEGLAVAVDDMLFNRQLPEKGDLKFIDDYCRDQKEVLPSSLKGVINIDGFGSLPNEVSIPFTASFSKFLIRKYGVSMYKNAYTSLKETQSPDENTRALEKIYHTTETDLIRAWKQSIGIT